ncbi:hypothetical protein AUP68_11414 [Ilyonectria robusta]
MSTTVSSASASASAGSCGATLYDIPIKDAVCAMPYSKNHTSIMAACCNDADVVSYYNNCGLYCLALDQTIAELTNYKLCPRGLGLVSPRLASTPATEQQFHDREYGVMPGYMSMSSGNLEGYQKCWTTPLYNGRLVLGL